MSSNNHEPEDAEANIFAICLLMPEELVRAEIQRMGKFDLCDDRAISRIASKFKVPDSIAAVRIGMLLKS